MRETTKHQNHGIAQTILRIFLAALLALTIFPIANNIGPDPFQVTDAPMPPRLASEINAQVTALAAEYRIPTPNVRFVASKVAGVTTRNATDQRAGPAEIRLGTPVQQEVYRRHPELLKAVVSHETGHAIMQARNDDFPAPLILVMYAIGLLPFLLVWPTVGGLTLAAILTGMMISGFELMPALALPHDAYLAALGSLSIGSLVCGAVATDHAEPARMNGRTRHLPAPRALGFAAAIALPTFFASAWLVGKLNVERELRADVIGACATSAQTMREALGHLSATPRSPISEALDFFHPSLAERQEVLGALDYPPRRHQICADVQLGTTPLAINGRIVQ